MPPLLPLLDLLAVAEDVFDFFAAAALAALAFFSLNFRASICANNCAWRKFMASTLIAGTGGVVERSCCSASSAARTPGSATLFGTPAATP